MKLFFEDNDKFGNYLSRRKAIEAKMDKLFFYRFKNSPLTRESATLLYLVQKTDLSQAEIAKHLHITQATLSERIKRLERDGYLTRVPDPKDKRKHKLVLNEKAEEEVNDCVKRINKMAEQLFKNLTADDYDHVMHILDVVEENMKGMLKEYRDD